MRAVDTPIGKGIVLPPCCPPGVLPGHDPAVKHHAVGDIVDVDEDCPTCEGVGSYVVATTRRMAPDSVLPAAERINCPSCNDHGTVSVPRVVTEVLPMFAASHPCGNGAPHLYLRRGEWRRCDGRGVGSTHVGAIPGAQPGGVVLVVERKP